MSLYDGFVLKLNIWSHQCCVICSLEGAQTTVSSRLLIKVLNRTTLRRQHCSISFVFNIQMEHNTLTSHPYNDPSEPGSTIFWFSTYPDYNILSWNARILWKTELKAFERWGKWYLLLSCHLWMQSLAIMLVWHDLCLVFLSCFIFCSKTKTMFWENLFNDFPNSWRLTTLKITFFGIFWR